MLGRRTWTGWALRMAVVWGSLYWVGGAAAEPRNQAAAERPLLRISEAEARRAAIYAPEIESLSGPLDVELVLTRRGRVEQIVGLAARPSERRRLERNLRKWRFFPIVAQGQARRAITTFTLGGS